MTPEAIFDICNDELARQFGYRLDPLAADMFRARCAQLGLARSLEAIRLCADEIAADIQERHCILEAIMWEMVAPEHTLGELMDNHARAIAASAVE